MASFLLTFLAFVNVHAFNTPLRHFEFACIGIFSGVLQAHSVTSESLQKPAIGSKPQYDNFNGLVEVLIQHIENYLGEAKSYERTQTKPDAIRKIDVIERALGIGSCNSKEFDRLNSLECIKAVCRSITECNEALQTSLAMLDSIQEIEQIESNYMKALQTSICDADVCISPSKVSLSLSQASPVTVEVINNKASTLRLKVRAYDTQLLVVEVLNRKIKPYATTAVLELFVKVAEAKGPGFFSSHIAGLTYEDLELKAKETAFVRKHSPAIVQLSLCDTADVCLNISLRVEVASKLADTERLNFGVVNSSTRQTGFVTITNPFTSSVAFKVFVGPSFDELMALAADCSRSKPQILDEDEFEVRYAASAYTSTKACQTAIENELIKARTTKIQTPRRQPTDLSLIGKLFSLLQEAKQVYKPAVSYAPNQPFQVYDSNLHVLKAGESIVVGPIVYHPVVEGQYNATLYIKNNHTVFDTVTLTGTAELPSVVMRLPGCATKNLISIQLEKSDLESKIGLDRDDRQYPIFKFPIVVELVNPNHIPVTVYAIQVAGAGCSAFGLTVEACDRQLTMQAKETIRLNMYYTPRFNQELSYVKVLVFTESGVQVVTVEVRVPYPALSYIRSRSFSWLVWERCELIVTELVILASALLGGGIFAMLIWVDWGLLREETAHHPATCKLETDASVCSSTPMETFELAPKPFEFPLKATDVILEQETSSSEAPTPPIALVLSEDPVLSEAPAPEPINIVLAKPSKPPKKKIKEAKIYTDFKATNPMRKAPSKTETKFIATNQLIMLPKTKKSRTIDIESDTSTSFAEANALDDEAIYLDTYKSNELFGGPCEEWVSQQELLTS